jgi:hypothetical protein
MGRKIRDAKGRYGKEIRDQSEISEGGDRMNVLSFKTIYGDEIKGVFIPRSADTLTRFIEVMDTASDDEKNKFKERYDKVVETVSEYALPELISLVLVYENTQFVSKAEEAVMIDKEDPTYQETLDKETEKLRDKRKVELEGKTDLELREVVMKNMSKLSSLTAGFRAAYKFIIFETFRKADNLREKVFANPDQPGQDLESADLDKLINARMDFDNKYIGEKKAKNA